MSRAIEVVRTTRSRGVARDDRVVVEEPLEIRLDGDTLAVTMRTPGHDRELVLGFLVSEGIVREPSDVAALAHCGKPGEPGYENTMAVTLASTARPPIDARTGELVRRGTLVSSACGVCGRRTLDDILSRIAPTRDTSPISEARLLESVAALRGAQPVFEATGGAHAASLFTFGGERLAAFEDVGRHNAVDKVVGARFLAHALGEEARVLAVSGRASFEIVQKALAAGFSALASVSAPSSLAVQLAREANLVLAGFVRGTSLVLYAGEERVT